MQNFLPAMTIEDWGFVGGALVLATGAAIGAVALWRSARDYLTPKTLSQDKDVFVPSGLLSDYDRSLRQVLSWNKLAEVVDSNATMRQAGVEGIRFAARRDARLLANIQDADSGNERLENLHKSMKTTKNLAGDLLRITRLSSWPDNDLKSHLDLLMARNAYYATVLAENILDNNLTAPIYRRVIADIFELEKKYSAVLAQWGRDDEAQSWDSVALWHATFAMTTDPDLLTELMNSSSEKPSREMVH